jgi:hypothetical protein
MHNPDRLAFEVPPQVRVIAGKHAGRVGEAVAIFFKKNRIWIEVEFGAYRATFGLGVIEQIAAGRIERGSDEERRAYACAAVRRREFS